jgi:integrase
MLAGGADISTVSKLLGHASIAITAAVYAHSLLPWDNGPWTVPQRIAHTVHTQLGVRADVG